MMIANAQNLIITTKPANQRNTLERGGNPRNSGTDSLGSGNRRSVGSASSSGPHSVRNAIKNPPPPVHRYDQSDSEEDEVVEYFDGGPIRNWFFIRDTEIISDIYIEMLCLPNSLVLFRLSISSSNVSSKLALHLFCFDFPYYIKIWVLFDIMVDETFLITCIFYLYFLINYFWVRRNGEVVAFLDILLALPQLDQLGVQKTAKGFGCSGGLHQEEELSLMDVLFRGL